MQVHIDIESRSRIDLKAEGVYKYAEHSSTQILWIAWAVGDGPVRSWFFRDTFPDELRSLFENEEVTFYAHNAAFERLMFQHCLTRQAGTPVLAIDRFYCTAVQARANALPDKLELCAKALGAREQKDHKGAALIRRLSIPRPDGTFDEDPAAMLEFGRYCEQDVRTERSIASVMRDLTEAERLDYVVSEEINDRGIMVDKEFAMTVTTYADAERALVKRRVTKLTGGQVTTPGSPKFTTWVYERLDAKHQHIMETTRNKSGFCFDAAVVERLFDLEYDLSREVWDALILKAASSKSSVSKFEAMLNRSDSQWRVRGALVLYGAGQTHRYSSRGLQLHNMPRDTADDPFEIRDQFIEGTVDAEELFSLLKSMVRPSIMPDTGKLLVCIDWAGIEARVLPWSTMDPRAQSYLDVFRTGADIYMVAAKDMPGNDRQLGKVATLALGYQGGVNAFQSMARNYKVFVEDHIAESVKNAWRRANPWAVDWWRNLETTAKRAVRHPGEQFTVGVVTYVCVNDTLFCILPSGTMLSYPQVRMDFDEEWDQLKLSCIKSSRRPKADETEWPRMSLYGGLLAENVTQAIAGDLLREALIRVREWSDEVVLHVHDEIVMEVPEAEAQAAYDDLHDEMLVVPEWAAGLPLDCEGWIGDYYRK